MLIHCINENYELDFVFNRHWQIWRSLVFVIDTNEMKIFVHTCYFQGLISTVSDVFLALSRESFFVELRQDQLAVSGGHTGAGTDDWRPAENNRRNYFIH